MEYLTSQNFECYFFTKKAFTARMEDVEAEWNTIVENYRKKKAAYEEGNRKASIAWNEFLNWAKSNNIFLTPAQYKSMKRSVEYKGYCGTAPSLWAWYTNGKDIVKVDANNSFKNLSEAYALCSKRIDDNEKNQADWEKRQKKAIQYCIEHDIDWDISSALSKASQHMTRLLEVNSLGTKIQCDCEECGEWVVSESNHRCECGAHRVALSTNGMFPDIYVYSYIY